MECIMAKILNKNLNKAKSIKNDEFYTQISDIEKELKNYKKHFKNAVVFCNCDDPEWSNFWRYFHLNFEFLGLKKLITTHYDPCEPTYKMEYEGGNDNDISDGIITPLKTNGDFRSPECIELLKQADIVVTNPPFSIAREFYIPLLFEYNKKFIVIGDLGWVTYKNIFPLFKSNKMWLGYNSIKEFKQPDNTFKKFGNKLWFTNLDIIKRHEKLELWQKYSSDKYPRYHNYDAIEVSKVIDIPMDYDGIMGVPISFMNNYNPEQFEIVGTVSASSDPDTLNLGNDYSKFIGFNQDGTRNGRTGSTFGKCPVLIRDDKKHPYYEYENIRVQATYPRIFIKLKESK